MRTYRVGATMGPLIGWNLIAAAVITGLITAALDSWGEERWTLLAAAAIVILMGPVSFIVYLVRYFMVRVAIGREGLILSKRYEVPWGDIERVRLKGLRPGGWNPFEKIEMGGCGWIAVALLFKVVVMILAVVLVLWILRTVFLPVVVLYSPWQSRVVIELADGQRLVYRDLEHADLFVEEVGERLA